MSLESYLGEREEVTERALEMIQKMYYEVNTMLGGENTIIPLEENQYHVAFSRAISTYRKYSTRSVAFKAAFLRVEKGKRIYDLPKEIDNVIRIRTSRSYGYFGGGLPTDGGIAAGLNDAGVLDSALLGAMSGSNTGNLDLLSYDLYLSSIENLSKVFGNSAVQFRFRHGKENKLEILDRIRVNSIYLIEMSAMRPLEELLDDHFARDTLLRLLEIEAKIMVARAIPNGIIPGPSGGTTLTWQQWEATGIQERKDLIDDILRQDDSAEGFAPMIFG